MSKHTPGPWHCAGIFNPDSPSATQWIWGPTEKGNSSGTVIARDVALRDVPLIAAAPELLEACKLALPYINGIGVKMENTRKAMKAAIQKAEGAI